MYVCMYVSRIYACMYACMHICMYVCMYHYVCVCMCVCLYVCLYVCMYVFFHACMYVCMYVSCMYVCMHVFIMYHVYIYACMNVCVYTHVHNSTHTHAQKHNKYTNISQTSTWRRASSALSVTTLLYQQRSVLYCSHRRWYAFWVYMCMVCAWVRTMCVPAYVCTRTCALVMRSW